MASTATSPEAYIAELPADRQKAITAIRKAIKKNIPKGFKEGICYGMIGYYVPLSVYPAGYHCNPKLPLMLAGLASQKNAISLHHLGIYGNEKLRKWFEDAYAKAGIGKLDMGKGCIRFKHPDKIPLTLIGELMSKLTVEDWVSWYESMLGSVKTKKAKK